MDYWLTCALVIVTSCSIIGVFCLFRATKCLAEESRRATTSQNVFRLLHFLQSTEAQDARRIVHMNERIGSVDWDTFTEEERNAVSRVCSTYDLLGIMIDMGIVPLEPFEKNWGWSIKECHKKLQLHIDQMRAKTGYDKYWDDFPRLARRISLSEDDD